MSKVIYSDYDTSQIRYIAQIMKAFLEKVLKNKEIKKGDLPLGVYETSLKFIELALDAESENPKNPSESYFNYYITAKTLDLSFPDAKSNPDRFKEIMEEYKSTLKSLNQVRKLNPKELTNLQNMVLFFTQMFNWADNVEYGKLFSDE